MEFKPRDDLFERPPSVRSGEPLKYKVVVQRRSDLLMQEQIEDVVSAQDSLQRALIELEHASSSDETLFFKHKVEELKSESEEKIVILKILKKLNSELGFARHNLKKAFKNHGDVNLARKRVNWLEERMTSIVGQQKKREALKTVAAVQSFQSRFVKQQPVEPIHVAHNDAGYVGDYSTDDAIEPEDLSSAGLLTPKYREPISYESTFVENEGRGTKKEHVEKAKTKDKPRKKEKKKEGTRKIEQSALMPEETFLTLYPASTQSTIGNEKVSQDFELDPQENDEDKQNIDQSETDYFQKMEEELEKGSYDVPSVAEDSTVDSEDIQIPMGINIAIKKQEKVKAVEPIHGTTPDQEKETPRTRSTTPEQSDDEERDSFMQGKGPSLITEGSYASQLTGRKSKVSRVTIRSPEASEMSSMFGDRSNDSDMDVESIDGPDNYWVSEHHRFEHHEYTNVLVELDPLSYHQVGLAVPGTFVEKPNMKTNIPWRKHKDDDYIDTQKSGLDKLSNRLHKMCEKIYDAAMLSVDVGDSEVYAPGRATQQNKDAEEIKREKSSVSLKKPTMAKIEGVNRPSSRETVVFPPLKKERLGSSYSGRLVYYPQPLTYPEKLPITRTNRSAEFPKEPTAFCGSVPGKTPRPERIVNQRKLYDETKFTSSLFKAKSKPNTPSTEEKFRKMLMEDKVNDSKTQSSIGKRKRLASTFKAAQLAISLQDDIQEKMSLSSSTTSLGSLNSIKPKIEGKCKWDTMKPKSGALDHSGLKWERVKGIVHNNLLSPNGEERRNAAMHLGAMKCGDSMVIYALKERLRHDADEQVKFEATKSLVTLGCWEEEVLAAVVSYLTHGTDEMRLVLVNTMTNGKNVQYVNKKLPSFIELSRILSLFCTDDDPGDELSVKSAICLGKLCVADHEAKIKLIDVIHMNKDTHVRAEALKYLIHQHNYHEYELVQVVLEQLHLSPVWRHRQDAAKLLIELGTRYVCVDSRSEYVYELLERRLWDDPNREVRLEVAKTLAALEMFPKACESVEKRLEDQTEEVRAQAVMSIATLGMKNERIIRAMLDMIGLDPSEYVRMMIIRTLAELNCYDKRVIRALQVKEKGDGPLAREAKRALRIIKRPAPASNKKK